MANNFNNVYIFGSEWMYVKIYMGEYIADRIVSEFFNLCQGLIANRTIDKWFYLRYYDPHFHIRIRFHLNDRKKAFEVLDTLTLSLSNYISSELVSKVQLETYVQEMKRYGGPQGIELAEGIFCCDSIVMSAFLNKFKENGTEDLRWYFGLLSLDKLMDDFKFSLEMKINLMHKTVQYFDIGAIKDKYLSKQIDNKFKKYQNEISNLLDNKNPTNSLRTLIIHRSQIQLSLIEEVLNRIENRAIKSEIMELVGSFMHMSCNRLFRVDARRNEFILYSLLLRYYKQKFYTK